MHLCCFRIMQCKYMIIIIKPVRIHYSNCIVNRGHLMAKTSHSNYVAWKSSLGASLTGCVCSLQIINVVESR